MLEAFKKIFGDQNSRYVKAVLPIVAEINSFEEKLKSKTDEDLKAQTNLFKKRLSEGETLDQILPEAFATVREVSRRVSGQRHFDVQLTGGIFLHRGSISEMKTGEGKTLVATLPAYLNALTGKGVHVVTVNDYLSRRDAVWMGEIYDFLGLSVGVLNSQESFLYDPRHRDLDADRDEVGSFKVIHEFLRECTRSEAYLADVTYGTNSEFGFDYLRDNIEYEKEKIRQREFNYAIIDEIDSILIDEARTPLIISAPTAESESLYGTFAKIASDLNENEDFEIEEKHRQIVLKESGIAKAEKKLGVDNIYTDKGVKYVHHLETAVKAKALFRRDKEYVVRDGQVIIVDEFTGRLQPTRRWSEGLHQAVEAKEGVSIKEESRTFASITYQNFFRMYKKLSGMTGTAMTSSEEFYKVYGLNTVAVPTNRPIARADQDDLIFQTEKGKMRAITRKVKELNIKGQPVLIGTSSVEKNELLSRYLSSEGVPHEVLNAKNNEREGEIIAQAGKKGGVTVATNMAGRGVDIKLGGNPAPKEAHDEIVNLGGLFVLGTERHEARRIDNQLRGRSGRQGDPGETQFFVSLEDQLMRVFASDTIKKMMGRFGMAEDEPIQNRLITRSLETAQKKIEGFHFDARKSVLEYDNVLNQQRLSIYSWRRQVLQGTNEEVWSYIEEEFFPKAPENLREILEKRKKELGEEVFFTSLRRLILQIIDLFWVDHLETMDYLRSSVNLRAYGQRDPLVEYKKEGVRLFKDLQVSVREKFVELIVNAPLAVPVATNPTITVSSPAPKNAEDVGRNDRVILEKDGKTKEIKFKKADTFLKAGWKIKEIIRD